MKIRFWAIATIFISTCVYSEINDNNELIKRIEDLENKIRDIEDIQKESTSVLKEVYFDSFFDRNSPAILDLRYSLSHFSPDEINEDTSKFVKSQNASASWENFESASIVDIEIGKLMALKENYFAEFSIGFQALKSESLEGTISIPGAMPITFVENVKANSLIIRMTVLHQILLNDTKWLLGPGFGFGYTPKAEIRLDIEQGNEGVVAFADGDGSLFETFIKSRYQISKFMFFTTNLGYRYSVIKDLRLNVGDIITERTKTKLDISGVFASIGIAINL